MSKVVFFRRCSRAESRAGFHGFQTKTHLRCEIILTIRDIQSTNQRRPPMTPAGVKGQREFLEGGASKETFEKDRGRVFTSGPIGLFKTRLVNV